MKNKTILAMDEKNAAVLTELIVGPNISGSLQIQAMQKLMEGKEDQSFFTTMLEEGLSRGKCPSCDHENEWLIPEDELNVQGHVSSEQDPRVPRYTNEKSCPKFQQACLKKKITV